MHSAPANQTQAADASGGSFRHLAQLGGVTSVGDCLLAGRHLLYQRDLIHGPIIEQFEREFARLIGGRYAFSFASGRIGLYGLLTSLGVGEGDEVLIQAPTHIVVANAIRYTGARPVYVDCRPETFNMDPEYAENHVTPQTRVLLLQHTFGIPADLDWAIDFAERHDLVIVEDCVHAMGSAYAGRMLGQFGKGSFFSTEETKTISTTMGGMVVTEDEELAAALKRFQESCDWPSRALTSKYVLKLIFYHLATQPYLHRYTRAAFEALGKWNPLPPATERAELRGGKPDPYEQRMSNAQASLGLRQLKRFDENIAHRKRIGEIYSRYLRGHGRYAPRPPDEADTAFVRYPVWVNGRERAMAAAAHRSTLGNWFTSVLEESESPEFGGYVAGSCPVAEDATRNLVNLPTHQRVTEADAEAIVSLVAPHARHEAWWRSPSPEMVGRATR